MNIKQRIFLLALILTGSIVMVITLTYLELYHSSLSQQSKLMLSAAKHITNSIELIGKPDHAHNKNHTDDTIRAMINEIVETYKQTGIFFGETGEITFGLKQGQFLIYYKLKDKKEGHEFPMSIKLGSHFAQPMQLALEEKTGVVTGLDYRGEKVLAAYDFADHFKIGVVIKVDLAKLRSPFIAASIKTTLSILVLSIFSMFLVCRIMYPVRKSITESEEQLRLLLNSTGEAIYGLNLSGECTLVNHACLKMLGYQHKNELLGKNMHQTIHHTKADGTIYPEKECKIIQAFKAERGVHVDDEVMWCADNTSFPVEYFAYPIYRSKKVIGSVVTFIDITERKKIEESLSLSDRVIESSKDLIAIIDENFIFKRVNKRYAEYHHTITHHIEGCYMSELIGMKRFETHFKSHIEKCLEGHEVVFECWLPFKGKGDRYVKITYLPLKQSNNEISNVVEVIRDITDRFNNEQKLKQDEKKFKALAELGKMGNASIKSITTFVLNKSKELTNSEIGFAGILNEDESFSSILDWSEAVMKQCGVKDQVLKFNVEGGGLWAEAIRQRKPVIVNDYETTDLFKKGTPDGHVKLNNIMMVPGFEGDKIATIMVVANKKSDYDENDVEQLKLLIDSMRHFVHRKIADDKIKSSYKKLQETHSKLQQTQKLLIRSEKLASLGALSAGVAHEIKNPLNIISTSAQMIMRALTHPEKITKKAQQIIDQALRAAKITENLRDFARQREPEITSINLHQMLDSVIALVEYEMKVEDIRFEKHYCNQIITLYADKDQLVQVFLNIINNGRDSMNEKQQRFKLTHESIEQCLGVMTIQTEVIQENIIIKFSDNGIGMNKLELDKVFDPFFTTKPVGKGTGLGMSISYGIIENHGGTIGFTNLDKGVCVTVTLPLHQLPQSHE